MTTYAEFQNNLEKDAITQSVSPGLYHICLLYTSQSPRD